MARCEAGLGACVFGAVPARGFDAADAFIPAVSSRASVSISFKLLFQTMTTASAPEDVKKSPPGEKLQAVAAPSCP